jgi:hypothetical protein
VEDRRVGELEPLFVVVPVSMDMPVTRFLFEAIREVRIYHKSRAKLGKIK